MLHWFGEDSVTMYRQRPVMAQAVVSCIWLDVVVVLLSMDMGL